MTKTLKHLTLKVINTRVGQANLFRNILFSKQPVKGTLSSDFLLVIFQKITNHLIVLKSENT
ncbi:hypothetical protein [Chryseobacterium scophthalmum]|uniref:hypothetical protein n=1 Tax=Chryseobacterium scophthalmum TaxID=59733 RepID=UPI003CFDC733